MSSRGCSENRDDRDETARFSVLVVSDSDEERSQLERIVGDAGLDVAACSSSAAQIMLAAAGPDVALLCIECDDPDLLANSRRLRPETPMLVAGSKVDVRELTEFIRAGACDFVQMPCSPKSLVDRLRAAVSIKQRDRVHNHRLERLKGICRRLSRSKREISSRLDELQQDLETCRNDVSQQLDITASSSAFRALVSQELGVEDVLRTGLEYILAKTGPTNVAAFLANSETEFTLGAYVNYECPRNVADRFLEQLASDVCPHVAREGELVRFQDVDRFVEAIGPEAKILQDSDVVAMPCSWDGECMAVLFLFRDSGEPFEDELAATLDSIRQIFGEQLAAVVRVHHRMEAEWPPEAADDQEEGTDWGFGEGPLAA